MAFWEDLEVEYANLNRHNSWKSFYESIDDKERRLSGSLTIEAGTHPLNTKLNRYTDIIPYDQTIVKLKDGRDTNYINANFVEYKLANRRYILTQSPIKRTLEHFWQMVWEQDVKGIIMLTLFVEKNTAKCEVYFPNLEDLNQNNEKLTFGRFELNFISEEPLKGYTIRQIELENLDLKDKRTIYHCQYTDWPDFGEPQDLKTFISFMNKCYDIGILDDVTRPAIVHCSAGIGRSGTFVLIDVATQLFKLYGNDTSNERVLPKRLPDLLLELRKSRRHLVQTASQLKFAYEAIIKILDGLRNVNNHIAYGEEEDGEASHIRTYDSDDSDEDELRDDDDDDDDDDDFYEDEAEGDQSKRGKKRAGTARPDRYHKFDASKGTKKKIKKLREIQEKNRLISRPRESHERGAKQSQAEDIESLSDSSDDSSNQFSSSRDIGTVRVNVARKPLVNPEEDAAAATTIVKTNNIPPLEKLVMSTNNDKNPSPSTLLQRRFQSFASSNSLNAVTTSQPAAEKPPTVEEPVEEPAKGSAASSNDKDKRIADMVKKMKEKQVQHEKRKSFFENVKSYLFYGSVGGAAILASGIFLYYYLGASRTA